MRLADLDGKAKPGAREKGCQAGKLRVAFVREHAVHAFTIQLLF
jgi:hypothetical protein